MSNTHTIDPILEELHAVREQLHNECGGDLAKLVADMRKRQDLSGHPVAAIPVSSRLEPQPAR